MEIGKTLYVTNRSEWRSWLKKNYNKEKEIWLIYYRKKSGKKRIPYNDCVEEALCLGWIDGILKGIDEEKYAQRFSPRRKNSILSELNKERILMMVEQKKMTSFGLEIVKKQLKDYLEKKEIKIEKEIMKELKKDKKTWENFQKFPERYKKIRIAWIESARSRPEMFERRLRYFIKMTEQNKKYGQVAFRRDATV